MSYDLVQSVLRLDTKYLIWLDTFTNLVLICTYVVSFCKLSYQQQALNLYAFSILDSETQACLLDIRRWQGQMVTGHLEPMTYDLVRSSLWLDTQYLVLRAIGTKCPEPPFYFTCKYLSSHIQHSSQFYCSNVLDTAAESWVKVWLTLLFIKMIVILHVFTSLTYFQPIDSSRHYVDMSGAQSPGIRQQSTQTESFMFVFPGNL